MDVTSRMAIVVLALAACSKGSSTAESTGSAAAGSAVGSGGSAYVKTGGFAASLSAEMAKDGSAGVAVGGGSATAAVGSASDPSTGSTSGSSAGPPAIGSAAGVGNARTPVAVPPELAAIKLDLEPNWDRDVGEAGTISFVLKVPSSNDSRLFSFHYGYDPTSAPSDRDAYMRWVADQKLLSVSLNRQRGAAWYLEGTDASSLPAFRYLVMYGGKHLICWGSLYKDPSSNSLGDLRDKVVMAAKKICETMTL